MELKYGNIFLELRKMQFLIIEEPTIAQYSFLDPDQNQ